MNKNFFLNISFLIVLLVTISCKKEHCVESEIMDLMLECSGKEKEFNEYLLKVETEFVRQGILEDRNGASYYHIFESIAETGKIDFEFGQPLTDYVNTEQVSQFVCNDSITLSKIKKLSESEEYQKSRIAVLQTRFDSLLNLGLFDAGLVAKEVVDVLSPRDFNHIYYKYTTLSLIITTQAIDDGLSRKLPPPEPEGEKEIIEARNLVNITIKNKSVELEGQVIKLEDLTKKLEEYLSVQKISEKWPEFRNANIPSIGDCKVSQVVFELQCSKGVEYDFYLEVQNSMQVSYRNVREKMSMKYFRSSFQKLDKKEQFAIKQLVPQRITEI